MAKFPQKTVVHIGLTLRLPDLGKKYKALVKFEF